MNSQSWLRTYLTQNGLQILLLKWFINFEFCVFRQQSEFLSVGQCPSLAGCFPMPPHRRVRQLMPAHPRPGRCSWLRTGAAEGPPPGRSQTSGVAQTVRPKNTSAEGSTGADTRHSGRSYPTAFHPKTVPLRRVTPDSQTHPPVPIGRTASFYQNLWHRFHVLLS